MKRVLIITYYWPPSGGAGVQRWLKTVKYLRGYDWEPVVFTAVGGESPVTDSSLLHDIPDDLEVLEQKIWEPYSLYKKFIGQNSNQKIQTGFLKQGDKPAKLESLSVWIRGNLFIPDARKFWIRPSINHLRRYLKSNKIDAIVSTGPPHSTHLIALKLHQEFEIPWMADFRDPWTDIDFYHKLKLSAWADKKHRRLEAKVLQSANAVVTVTNGFAKDLEESIGRRIDVITNGFDHEDFSSAPPVLDTRFTIVHIGSMNEDRNPHALWRALEKICASDEKLERDLEIVLIGSTDISVHTSVKQHGLTERLRIIKHLPHQEVTQNLRSAQVLLLPINDSPNSKGVVPGKLFEYLAAERPILCIGPLDGDAAAIISKCRAGSVHQFSDEESISAKVVSMYEDYRRGHLEVDSTGIGNFTRKSLAAKIAAVLDRIS